MFEEVHTLPKEWASYVKPALKTISSEDFKNALDFDSLTPFLKSDNPLVSLTAARALNQKRLLQGEALTSALNASYQSPTLVATQALIFWSTQKFLPLYSAEDTRTRNADAEAITAKVVQNAKTKDLIALLKGLQAGGVFIAYNVFDLTPAPDFGATLLRVVAAKVELPPTVTDTDKEAKTLIGEFQLEPHKQPK